MQVVAGVQGHAGGQVELIEAGEQGWFCRLGVKSWVLFFPCSLLIQPFEHISKGECMISPLYPQSMQVDYLADGAHLRGSEQGLCSDLTPSVWWARPQVTLFLPWH